jgi:hypothetical protein
MSGCEQIDHNDVILIAPLSSHVSSPLRIEDVRNDILFEVNQQEFRFVQQILPQ